MCLDLAENAVRRPRCRRSGMFATVAVASNASYGVAETRCHRTIFENRPRRSRTRVKWEMSAKGNELMMRLSLDGGKTWVTGTKKGTPFYNRSKAYEFAVKGPGSHTSVSPTVEISPNHFLTIYGENYKGKAIAIRGLFWHIEPASGN